MAEQPPGGQNPGSLMQQYKQPPKSPESPEISEPSGENQEAMLVFQKGVGVGKQRKLSRNKQTNSATIIG